MEETGYSRPGRPEYPERAESFIGRAIDAYLFRKPNVPLGRTWGDIVRLLPILMSSAC